MFPHGADPLAIAAIRPHYSIISVGSNPHGHPNSETLSIIEAHTAERVFRTSRGQDGKAVVAVEPFCPFAL